jgi:hypothetical protein
MAEDQRMIGAVAEDALLSLPEEWTETAFEREKYAVAGERREGLAATLEGDGTTTAVVPVAVEHTARGTLHVDRLGGGTMVEGSTVPPETPLDRRPAFAAELTYERGGAERSTAYTITEDADDALAVACWLAIAVARGRSPDRAARRHRGTDGTSDDVRVAGKLRGSADRCLVSGRPTSSHPVALPFRYSPLLAGYPATFRDVPAVPSRVGGLRAVLSHSAWSEHDLEEAAFEAGLDRESPGEYRLSAAVTAAVRDAPAERVGYRELGTE